MNRIVCVAAIVLGCWQFGGPAAAAPPLPRVPDGFEIQIAAEFPIVERPVMACFDKAGRLYLVDSAGVNEPFEKLLANPQHRIVVIEDTDGDGKFDKRTLFADKLVMPQGVLPYNGAVYTASPPSVWKLEDTDGDGVCDKRTAIVSEFGSNGNAADIHGPFLGPDGWLYLCDGRHGHKVTLEDGTIDQGLAGGIFRFRTDGTGFERICGGGFDNPVEIDFTDAGEILGTVNILHGNPRQDCLMHWMEGGVYPHADQEQCIAEYKKTGDLLTEVKAFGHVAVSGMTIYRSRAFGGDYHNDLFITFFNRHQVIRSIVERSGATFTTRDEEFLVSDDKDFHPTDVLEDLDGSLLVINTGGWFRIGCPVSEIAKPDVMGAIYRVKKTGASSRRRAFGGAPWFKVNAREETLTSFEHYANQLSALDSDNETSRITSARRFGRADFLNAENSREQAVDALIARVVKDTPAVRREAANAIGRLAHGSEAIGRMKMPTRAVKSLFESLRAGVTDRVLEHALIYALIRIDSREATLPFLNDENPQIRRSALIALDQMDHGDLTRELVTPLLDTDDPALRKTALAAISARQGWATELVGLLREWLADKTPTSERLSLLRGALVAQGADPDIQKLIAESIESRATPQSTRLLLWEVIDRAPVAVLPETWLAAMQTALGQGSALERTQIVAVIHSRGLTQFDEGLLRIVGDAGATADLRVDALAAAAPRLKSLDDRSFTLLLDHIKPQTDPLPLLAAARGLADAPLSVSQLQQLAATLPTTGPLALPIVLRAYAKSVDGPVGLAFVAALGASSAVENLSVDELAGILRKYPSSVQKEAGPLLARLGGSNLDQQKARLTELTQLLEPAGDRDRGKTVFFGKKAACSSCHTVGADGGRVGPDLTKIGASRSGTDLLEAIVFPSATFAREFRPYVILTRDGKVHTGIISRQTTDAIHLRTADLAEIRIARDEVEEMKESNTSIMPKGLETALSADELRDLLAYVRGLQ